MISNKYSPDQWAFMNLPTTQQKIQRDLKSAVARFLDTAPERSVLLRASVILEILKDYFERQLTRDDGDAYDRSKAEEVLIALSDARRRMRTDQDVEKSLAEVMASAPLSEEELAKQVKEWEAFEARLKAEGKEHWWD
jgi:hypothetical protein